MKPISLDLYKYLYRFTGAKEFSYYFALLAVASLHVIVLNGFTIVVKPWLGSDIFQRLFTFPFCLVIGAIIFFIGYRRMPYAILSKEKQIQPTYSRLAVYAVLAVVVLAYGHFIK